MRVRCIGNDWFDLTAGNVYLVEHKCETSYWLKNDKGILSYYPMNTFEVVKPLMVECINNISPYNNHHCLTIGKFYPVEQSSDVNYTIYNDIDVLADYPSSYFKIPPINQEVLKMKVRCLDNRDGKYWLTIGKVYDATGEFYTDDIYYSLVNDNGIKTAYKQKYFEVVSEIPKVTPFVPVDLPVEPDYRAREILASVLLGAMKTGYNGNSEIEIQTMSLKDIRYICSILEDTTRKTHLIRLFGDDSCDIMNEEGQLVLGVTKINDLTR